MTYIEVEADDPSHVLYVHDRPALGLGALGCFDDSGAMPSWIVNRDGLKYLYYIGWNVGATVPYRNSIGLAVSNDGGRTFAPRFDGPILERTHTEPHFCATPCVLEEGGFWRMWYLSCVGWEILDRRPEPRYHIKYAESDDGIVWDRRGVVAIDFASPLRELSLDRGSLGRAASIGCGTRAAAFGTTDSKGSIAIGLVTPSPPTVFAGSGKMSAAA